MKWINNAQMTTEQVERLGELRVELKGLTKSTAETVRIAVITAIYVLNGDIEMGLAQAWQALKEAYALRQFKGSKDSPLSQVQKERTESYNAFYKAWQRTSEDTASIWYGEQEIVKALDFSSITRDNEFNGDLDMAVALVNWESETKRRKTLAEKRSAALAEKAQQAAASKRAADRQAEIEAAVNAALANV